MHIHWALLCYSLCCGIAQIDTELPLKNVFATTCVSYGWHHEDQNACVVVEGVQQKFFQLKRHLGLWSQLRDLLKSRVNNFDILHY